MRLFSLSLFALSTLVACGSEEPAPEPAEEAPAPAAEEPTPEPPAEEPPAAAFDAKGTFETVCATCHGATGKGDGPAGAALDPKPADFSAAEFWNDERTDDYLKKVIAEGGTAVGKSPLMAPYGGQYDEAQIDALVAHIKTFEPAE